MKLRDFLRGMALLLALLLPVAALAEAVDTEMVEDAARLAEAAPDGSWAVDGEVDPEALALDGAELFDVDLIGLLPEDGAEEAPLSDAITPPAGEEASDDEAASLEETDDPAPEAAEPAGEDASTMEGASTGEDASAVEGEAEIGEDPLPTEGTEPVAGEDASVGGEAMIEEDAQPAEGGDGNPWPEAAGFAQADPEAEDASQAEEEEAPNEEDAPDEEEADGELEEAELQVAEAAADGSAPVFPKALKLGVKETFTLDASGALSGQLVYVSSNAKVASVNAATGVVTGRKKGTAKIAAVDAAKHAVICTVTVLPAPAKIALSKKSLTLCLDATGKLAAQLPKKTASRVTFASGNEAVVQVDASGKVIPVAAGTATVTATTFNGKRASCKVRVLNGNTPKTLGLNKTKVYMGLKEKLTLKPVLADGCAAAYSWSSSNRKIATVSASGVVKAKKKGKVKITVKTHNGLKKSCWIKVVKAPKKVAISSKSLSLKVGDTRQLSAKVPKGTASQFTWSTGNAAVATVSASGKVTAVGVGTTKITVRVYTGKKASCTVTVRSSSEPAVSQMAARIRNASSVGDKRDALAGIVELLVTQGGYEPAFAAGVAANVWCEGSYGFFESSRYVTYPKNRPRYFCYLDGGKYYKSGVLQAEYVSKADYEKYGKSNSKLKPRFATANFYLNNYSSKYAWQINLTGLEATLAKLEAGGWVGKFGLGVTQWTGPRTKGLVEVYRKHAGSGSTITKAQVVAAENEMILKELKTTYAFVYNNWKSAGRLTGASAAGSAAEIFCRKYEVPANVDSAAATRASRAKTLYNIMMG